MSLEQTRGEDWKMDGPTIDNICAPYHDPNDSSLSEIVYLKGIGKRVSSSENQTNSPCHWGNQTWTLQEFFEATLVVADGEHGLLMRPGHWRVFSMGQLGGH